MLFVMLMGSFPFDHIRNPDPDSRGAYKEVLRQQTRGKWSDCAGLPNNRHLIKLLTTPCKDLLDSILTADADKRISLQELKKHPWFNRKLPTHLESKLAQIENSQALLNNTYNDQKSNYRTKVIDEMCNEAQYSHCPVPAHEEALTDYFERLEGTDSLLEISGIIRKLHLKTSTDSSMEENYMHSSSEIFE